MKQEPSTARQLRGFNYAEYLQSDVWQARRQWKLDAADQRCQVCNADDKLQVHHRTYERVGQERECDLIVLCEDCHKHFHGIKDEPPKPEEYTKPVAGIIPNPARWGEHANRAAEIAREITIAGPGATSIALLEEKRRLAILRRAELKPPDPE